MRWGNREKRKEKVECFRCGEIGHRARECKEVKCYSCDQKGHIKGECTTKKGNFRWEREVSKDKKKVAAEQEAGRRGATPARWKGKVGKSGRRIPELKDKLLKGEGKRST